LSEGHEKLTHGGTNEDDILCDVIIWDKNGEKIKSEWDD
jgi:hypothetical protein